MDEEKLSVAFVQNEISIPIYGDVVAAELVEEFESLEDVAREYVKTVRNANYGDISPSLHKGNSSEDYSDYLKEGTRYVAWAVGYRDDDTDGGLTTSVFSIEFTF